MIDRSPISIRQRNSWFLAAWLWMGGVPTLEAAVVINEIYYHPPSETQAEEFVELHNTGPSAVNLEGWRLETGIDFRFGDGNTIPPGGYLVATRTLSAFHAAFPTFVGRATGNFSRNLGNSGDRLDLRNSAGEIVDTVEYGDSLPWPDAADGSGASLELIHPRLDNSHPASWRASNGSPTPGQRNSTFNSNPRPIVAEVRHTPLAPKPSDPILITARCHDEQPGVTARVFYRTAPPASSPPTVPGGFAELPMFDDGLHSDGLPGDGVFGAFLPPRPEGAILEFHVQARDSSGQTTLFPATAPTGNALLRVASTDHPNSAPVYRIVMTPQDLQTLRTRFVFDDTLLNCTFIGDGEVYYGKGIRYRGSSSRVLGPRKSFRIELTDDAFQGRGELNLNGTDTAIQAVAWDLFAEFGLANPLRRVVHLDLNGEFLDSYFQIETIDTPFLRDNFGEDRRGNLYRGVETADLRHLGPLPDPYRVPYAKKNNRAADDYSDIIELTRIFSLDSQEEFETRIEEAIDVRQWLRFFALHSVLANMERGIQLGEGDDYFLYRREDDQRFIMLPWDLDGAFGPILEPLFRQTLPSIARLIQNPRFVRYYYEGIEQILEGVFRPDFIEELVESYRGIVPDQPLEGILFFANARREFLLRQYPRQLTLEFPDGEIPSLEECPRPLISDETLRLQGTAHAAFTTSVRVNGVETEWSPMEGTWEFELPLEIGDNQVALEAVDDSGAVRERIDFSIFRVRDVSILAGRIGGDLTLRKSDSPFRIVSHLQIPATATLTIEPGCLVLLDTGVGIRVDGRVVAKGTVGEPIAFRPAGCTRWGGIALQSKGNVFEHCEFDRASFTEIEGVPAPMAITLNGGGATVTDCFFLECVRVFNVNGGGDLDLRRTRVLRCELAVFGANSDFRIEDCRFEESRGGYDVVQAIGKGKRTPVIQGCRFAGGQRDAIDLNGIDALLFRNEIRGFPEGSGVRARGSLGPRLVRNLIVDCRRGISLDPYTPARIEHQTLSRNEIAIDLTGEGTESGASFGHLRNSILWANDEDLRLGENPALAIEYSNLGSQLFAGEGNQSINPLFALPSAGDYRLRANSPSLRKARNGLDMGAYQQTPGRTGFLRVR